MKIIKISTIPLSLNVLLKGQLKYLSAYFEIIGISSSGKELEEVREREGVRTIPVKMYRGINPIGDLISLFNLYVIFKKEKPTIVHSITPKAGLLSMLAALLAGVPLRMHTFTGLIFPTKRGVLKKVLIKMDQLLCWSATHIYPEGDGVKRDLQSFQITNKPLKVIANGNVNGIDLKYYSKEAISSLDLCTLKSFLEINEEDFVFIFVGRLVGDKGINELAAAFEQLPQEKVKLLLVGPMEAELDPLSAKTLQILEKNNNIISLGFQKDVRPYLHISHALVFPSYREGFPNVVMQAGAMELPCIVTDINGANEIILDGQNGTIIRSKDVESLKHAMLKIMQDKVYYVKLREKARALITSRYEQSLVWEAILHEYRLVLTEKGISKHV